MVFPRIVAWPSLPFNTRLPPMLFSAISPNGSPVNSWSLVLEIPVDGASGHDHRSHVALEDDIARDGPSRLPGIATQRENRHLGHHPDPKHPSSDPRAPPPPLGRDALEEQSNTTTTSVSSLRPDSLNLKSSRAIRSAQKVIGPWQVVRAPSSHLLPPMRMSRQLTERWRARNSQRSRPCDDIQINRPALACQRRRSAEPAKPRHYRPRIDTRLEREPVEPRNAYRSDMWPNTCADTGLCWRASRLRLRGS